MLQYNHYFLRQNYIFLSTKKGLVRDEDSLHLHRPYNIQKTHKFRKFVHKSVYVCLEVITIIEWCKLNKSPIIDYLEEDFHCLAACSRYLMPDSS